MASLVRVSDSSIRSVKIKAAWWALIWSACACVPLFADAKSKQETTTHLPNSGFTGRPSDLDFRRKKRVIPKPCSKEDRSGVGNLHCAELEAIYEAPPKLTKDDPRYMPTVDDFSFKADADKGKLRFSFQVTYPHSCTDPYVWPFVEREESKDNVSFNVTVLSQKPTTHQACLQTLTPVLYETTIDRVSKGTPYELKLSNRLKATQR